MDWMVDLQSHPLHIEGAWLRVCCLIWRQHRNTGKITKTLHEWAEIWRVPPDQAMQILGEIRSRKIGGVSKRRNNVTFTCWRVERDAKLRERNRLRKADWRASQDSHAEVTREEVGDVPQMSPGSSISTSISSSTSLSNKSKGQFLFWYKKYPRQEGEDAAWRIWSEINPDPVTVGAMVEAVEIQKKSEAWRKDGGKWIPKPENWLRDGRWKDKPSTAGAMGCVVCHKERHKYQVNGKGEKVSLCKDCFADILRSSLGLNPWGKLSPSEIERFVEQGKANAKPAPSLPVTLDMKGVPERQLNDPEEQKRALQAKERK
jgi:hypothetical protein